MLYPKSVRSFLISLYETLRIMKTLFQRQSTVFEFNLWTLRSQQEDSSEQEDEMYSGGH